MLYQRSPSQIQIQRHQRHDKLIKMIRNYKRSAEDYRKLQKIKDNTVMEINLRYVKSAINKNYKFPKTSNPQSDSQEQNNPILSLSISKKQSTFQDLMMQNQVNNINNKPKQDPFRKKIYSIEPAQRVKSLDKQLQINNQQWRLTTRAIDKLSSKQNSQKQFRKIQLQPLKHTQSGTKLHSKLPLPSLKHKKQNVKTQKSQGKQAIINPFITISSVINKKLMTQIQPADCLKMKGLQLVIKKKQSNQSPKKIKGRRYFQRPLNL